MYHCYRYIGNSNKVEIKVDQCESCGFIFNTNRLGKEQLQDYYENSLSASGQVYRDTSSQGHYPILHAERAKYLKSSMNILHDGLFIDVGCGSGGFIEASKNYLPQFDYLGVDPSESAVKNCKAKGIKALPGYLDDVNLKDGDVSLISAISVLEHITEPRSLLMICREKLKSEGILYLEVPNVLDPELQLTGFFNLEHVVHFTPYTLTKLLCEVGFSFFKLDFSARNVIRIIASGCEQSIITPHLEQIPDDRLKSLESISNYYLAEQNLYGKMLEKLNKIFREWKSENLKIAVYGAGAHTIELASIFDLQSYVMFYIDGDPRKHGTQFLGKTVISPAEVKKNNIDAVLISSGRFQSEMVAAISKYDIKIEMCYD